MQVVRVYQGLSLLRRQHWRPCFECGFLMCTEEKRKEKEPRETMYASLCARGSWRVVSLPVYAGCCEQPARHEIRQFPPFLPTSGRITIPTRPPTQARYPLLIIDPTWSRHRRLRLRTASALLLRRSHSRLFPK